MSKSFLLSYAEGFAKTGVISVMVDLQAQGASTGSHVGFGKREAADLRQLVAGLSYEGLRPKAIGIFGISYGAAVALDAAALMPSVKAVVAVAPYARVGPAIRAFVNLQDPRKAAEISDATIKRALTLAGKIIGYRLSLSDPSRWVGKIKAHVLYIAGATDRIAPLSGIKLLSNETTQSRLVVIPGANHMRLTIDDTKALRRYSLAWFRRFLNISK